MSSPDDPTPTSDLQIALMIEVASRQIGLLTLSLAELDTVRFSLASIYINQAIEVLRAELVSLTLSQ